MSVLRPTLLDMSSTAFMGSEGETSGSTSRTATPVLVEGPSNGPERMEPGNQVVLPNQPEQSTPATAEQPPQNSSGEPEPLNGPESLVQPGPQSSPVSSEQPGLCAKVTTEEGQPRNKRRKLNKQEKAGAWCITP